MSRDCAGVNVDGPTKDTCLFCACFVHFLSRGHKSVYFFWGFSALAHECLRFLQQNEIAFLCTGSRKFDRLVPCLNANACNSVSLSSNAGSTVVRHSRNPSTNVSVLFFQPVLVAMFRCFIFEAEIPWGSYGEEDDEGLLLGCFALNLIRNWPAFQRCSVRGI